VPAPPSCRLPRLSPDPLPSHGWLDRPPPRRAGPPGAAAQGRSSRPLTAVAVVVAPGLVEGTLRSGFETGGSLTSPFARAVFMILLVSEVHPFADGNGRITRMMMNVHAGELRIVIPAVYRLNYLAVLRAATHTSNDAALTPIFAQGC